MNWKLAIKELERITSGNGIAAWKTAKLVQQLWNDKEFLKSGCGGVLDHMTAKLAKFAGRFALGLNDMRSMIEQYPDRKEWEDGRLDHLRDRTAVELQSRKDGEESSKRKRRHLVSELETLKRKYDQLVQKYRQLQRDHRALLKRMPVRS